MKYLEIGDLYSLFVIALIKIVSRFSSSLPKDLTVKSIAFAAYHFSKKKRRNIEKNLSEVLDGKLSEHQRRDIVQGAFYEFWRETCSRWLTRQEKAALKSVEYPRVRTFAKGVEKWKGGHSLGKQCLGEKNLIKTDLTSKWIFDPSGLRGGPSQRIPDH